MKTKAQKFLNVVQQGMISDEIDYAEKKTSGEIVFSIASKGKGRQRAIDEFERLGIQQTEGATGVLIMLCLEDKQVHVVADQAINEKVDDKAWQTAVDMIIVGINQDAIAIGICNAIKHVGALLSEYFPIKEGDKNELSNAVSTS